MTVDIALVRRVLEDVIAEAERIRGIQYGGKPIYQIEHTTIDGILKNYKHENEA